MKGRPAELEYGAGHTPTCASGDRAEKHGPCDCGAVDVRPWRIRTQGEEIEIVVDRALTTREAMDLALTLQNLTIQTAHRNIARREKAEATAARSSPDR